MRRITDIRSLALTALPAMILLIVAVAGCGSAGAPAPPDTGGALGTSFDDAIKVGSIGEERDILNRTSCGDGGFFRKTHVEVRKEGDRYYDLVEAKCTEGGQTRMFYFDVSSCFPCPN